MFLVLHFEIRQRGVAPVAPVYDVIAAVDETLFVQLHKYLAHGQRKTLIHGEPLPVPVAGCAQAFELIDDGTAVFFTPLPDGLYEFFPAQLMAIGTLFGQFFFDNVLGRDSGVVRSRHPKNIVSLEPPVAAEDILHAVIQGMAHMEDPGYIRWWNNDGVAFARALILGCKKLFIFPELVPAFFDLVGFVTLVKLFETHMDFAPSYPHFDQRIAVRCKKKEDYK